MPSSEPAPTRHRQDVLADLATCAGLTVQDIEPDEDFLGLGIDSVRLMHLVEQWRAAGLDVSFAELAGCATVAHVLDHVTGAQQHHPTTAA